MDKNTERVRFLLQAAKAAFTEVDVSLSTVDKEYLHQHSKHDKKITLPQVFLDGEYLGVSAAQQRLQTAAPAHTGCCGC